MINKENLTQDRVKILWFLKHTWYFWGVFFIFWLYTWRSTGWKDGTGLKKGSIHYQKLAQKAGGTHLHQLGKEKAKALHQLHKMKKNPLQGGRGKAEKRFFAFLPLDHSILYKNPLNLALSECRFHLPLLSQASLNTVSSAIQAGDKRGNQTHNKNMRIGQMRIPRSKYHKSKVG